MDGTSLVRILRETCKTKRKELVDTAAKTGDVVRPRLLLALSAGNGCPKWNIGGLLARSGLATPFMPTSQPLLENNSCRKANACMQHAACIVAKRPASHEVSDVRWERTLSSQPLHCTSSQLCHSVCTYTQIGLMHCTHAMACGSGHAGVSNALCITSNLQSSQRANRFRLCSFTEGIETDKDSGGLRRTKERLYRLAGTVPKAPIFRRGQGVACWSVGVAADPKGEAQDW